MVSRGDEEANRAKVAEHGLTFPVSLQRQREVSRDYAMFATPVAYRINEEGIIVRDVAVGVDPILALLSGTAERHCPCGKPVGKRHPGQKTEAAAGTNGR